MAPKMKKLSEHLEQHGGDEDGFRIERRFAPEPDGEYHYVVYKSQHTGLEKDKKGNVTRKGKHPVIKTPDGSANVETEFEHVWVPVFAGPEDKARAHLKKLTG